MVDGLYFTKTRSVASYYSELSNGKMSITGDVFGWFTVAARTTSCDYGSWGAAARQAATASGVDLSGYTNVVHAFPRQSACWWSGMANLPGRNTWVNGSMTMYIASHELGHNLGVHHAASLSCTSAGVRVSFSSRCSADEYGDPFDVMGYTGQRHMHSWHRRQLGFLTAADVQTVTTHGIYRVAPAEVDGGSPRVLRVLRPAGDYYYLEFRQPYGLFDNFSPRGAAVNGVTIRIAPDLGVVKSRLIDTMPQTSSFSDAPLTVGRTFFDPVNTIYVMVLSVGPEGAEIAIQNGPDTVPPGAPTDLRAALDEAGTILLSWSPATDDAIVTGYDISRNGLPLGTIDGTTFTDAGLVQDATYTYSVVARDRSNAGPESTVAVYLPDTLAPGAPPSATATPAGPRSVLLSWEAASDNIGVSGYSISRDGTGLATVTETSFVDDAAPDGLVSTYQVRAYDAAGNVGQPIFAGVGLPDATPPRLSGELAVLTDGASVTLSWTPATDAHGVAGYSIQRDAVWQADTAETGWVDESVAAARAYEYDIVAYDTEGNRSEPLRGSVFVPDVSAPSAPTGLAAEVTGYHVATLRWDAATDNVGVDHYVVYRDGVALAVTSELELIDFRVEEGSAYVFSVRAVDAAGNFGAEVSTTLTVADVTPPGQVRDLTAVATTETSVALAWTAPNDNVGVTGFLVHRDGTVVASLPADTISYAESGMTSDQTYGYSVVALDAAGNVGIAATASVTLVSIDRAAPSIPTNLRALPIGGRRVSLTWSASVDDRPGAISYYVYRNARLVATVTTTAYTDRPAAVGTYRYRVRAVDAAGNVSQYSLTVTARAARRVP